MFRLSSGSFTLRRASVTWSTLGGGASVAAGDSISSFIPRLRCSCVQDRESPGQRQGRTGAPSCRRHGSYVIPATRLRNSPHHGDGRGLASFAFLRWSARCRRSFTIQAVRIRGGLPPRLQHSSCWPWLPAQRSLNRRTVLASSCPA